MNNNHKNKSVSRKKQSTKHRSNNTQDKEEHLVDTNMNGLSRSMKTILPPIKANPLWAYTRRYVASSTVSYDIKISDILNSSLFSTTTIVAYPIGRAIRIRKIRWLTPVTTQGTTVTLTVTPATADSANNSFTSLPQTYVDTSASIDRPAYISLKPSLDSPLGSWHLSTTVDKNLLSVNCPTGTTMDIFVEVLPNFSAAPLGYSQAIVGSTATMYVKMIGNFVPQGVNAI